MAVIVVIDPSNVTVDGVPAGSVLDVPANHAKIEGIRGLVLDALIAWHTDCQRCHGEHCKTLQEKHTAELDAAQKAACDERDAAIANLKASYEAKVAELAAKRQSEAVAKDGTIADLQAQVAALGGTELGQKMARQAACQELHRKRAAIDAELAAIATSP